MRYWNGGSFTAAQLCPTVYTVMLKYNTDLKELNGTWDSLTSLGAFAIDTPAFKDATTLSISGVSPGAGWYREGNAQNHFRRFWDGSQFIGTPIPEDFIYVYTNSRAALSTSIGTTACDIFGSVVHNVYFGKDNDYGGTYSSILPNYNTAYDSGGIDSATIYVEVAWNPNNVSQYEYPLIKAHDQNSPNSGVPYAQLVITTGISNNKKTRGSINSSSKLGAASLCLPPVQTGVFFDSSTSYSYAGIGDVPGGVSTEGVLVNTTSDTQYLGLIIQDGDKGFKIEYKRNNSSVICLSEAGTDYPNNNNPWFGQCLAPVNGTSGFTHFIGTIPANTTASDNYTWENAFQDSWTSSNIVGSNVNVELFYGTTMSTINQLVGTI